MAEPPAKLMTQEDFLSWEASQPGDEPHELIEGVPVAMADTSATHGELVTAVASIIRVQLLGSCRVLSGSLLRLPHRSGRLYRPDIMVVCGPRPAEPETGPVEAPSMVVEVLSPSTADFDRGQKLDDYQEIPTLAAVLLVYGDRRRVKVVRRVAAATWLVEHTIGSGAVRLDDPPLELALADLYGDIQL